MIALAVATPVSWLNRGWLLEQWTAPTRGPYRSGFELQFDSETALLAATLQVTLATALLLSFPVFCAEAWLLVCRLTRREQARRLTVPFAVTSAVAALLAFWLAREVEVVFFVGFPSGTLCSEASCEPQSTTYQALWRTQR